MPDSIISTSCGFVVQQVVRLAVRLDDCCMQLAVDLSGVAGPLAAQGGGQICRPFVLDFYAPQLYRQVLLRRVLAMGILSVCLSVCHDPVVYQAQVR